MDLRRQIELFEDLLEGMEDARNGVTLAQNANGISARDSAPISERRYRTKIMDMANNPEYAYLLNTIKDDILLKGIVIPRIQIQAQDQYELLGDISNALYDAVNLICSERDGQGKIVRYPSRILDLCEDPQVVEIIQGAHDAFVLGHLELPTAFTHSIKPFLPK